jgi:hypothetical protein
MRANKLLEQQYANMKDFASTPSDVKILHLQSQFKG